MACWAMAAPFLVAGCQAASLPPPSAPTGQAGPGLERFDAVVSGIIQEFQIPGAGFAIVNASKGKPEGPELHQEFRREILAAIAATAQWPGVDFFDRYR